MTSDDHAREPLSGAEPPLSPVKAARRERIVEAAERVFVAHGFRGTSFEGVAEAAGMSKVTVYGYFRDKEALFLAVAQRLARRLWQAVEAGFAASGPVSDRLAAGLLAKHRIVFDVIRGSLHAEELLAARSGMLAGIYDRLDGDIRQRMRQILAAEGLEPSELLAETLFNAADGCGRLAGDGEAMERQIRLLTRALIPPGV